MPSDGSRQELPPLALVGQLGLLMVGCVLLGCLAGRLLDGWFQTDPLFTVVLIVGGVLGGMAAVYRTVTRLIERDDRRGTDAPS